MAKPVATTQRALAFTFASMSAACSAAPSTEDESPPSGGASADAPDHSPPTDGSSAASALALVREEPARVFADGDTQFSVRRVFEEDTRAHVRLERRHRGLRVIGGDVIIHFGEGAPPPSGSRRRELRVDDAPRLFASEAIVAAIAALGEGPVTFSEPNSSCMRAMGRAYGLRAPDA